VCWNFDIANQGWIAPNAEGIVWKAARAHKLPVVVAELEAGYLRTSVDAVDPSSRGGVPEVDVSVIGATSRGEEIELPRAPAESLDRGTVIGLLEFGRIERSCIPDGNQVVVPSGCQLGTV